MKEHENGKSRSNGNQTDIGAVDGRSHNEWNGGPRHVGDGEINQDMGRSARGFAD
ncbi:hypothetical protein [uncultured Clostridium sp.]|uniref:hypothetical protein n=1 Tax=uncultured Clostridium sp. TaxID=59620 RepID=UPI0026306D35|nr:hypothetical protein [uncultured Clostridium sp.]